MNVLVNKNRGTSRRSRELYFKCRDVPKGYIFNVTTFSRVIFPKGYIFNVATLRSNVTTF